jgi:hypothetical protein
VAGGTSIDQRSGGGVAGFLGDQYNPFVLPGDALAEQPTEAPYYTEDVVATIYHGLGIPLDTTHQTPDGRPIQVNDEGRLIRELL